MPRTADPVQDAYLLHCLNHVAKAADRIKRNNERLEAARSAAAGATKSAAAAGGDTRGPQGDVAAPAVDVPRDQVGVCCILEVRRVLVWFLQA